MVKNGAVTAQEALSYAMSLPVTTTVSGMPSLAVLYQNLAIAGYPTAGGHGNDVHRLPAESDHVKRSNPARSAYDENLALAQNLVQNEPARAARMIKEWVNND